MIKIVVLLVILFFYWLVDLGCDSSLNNLYKFYVFVSDYVKQYAGECACSCTERTSLYALFLIFSKARRLRLALRYLR